MIGSYILNQLASTYHGGYERAQSLRTNFFASRKGLEQLRNFETSGDELDGTEDFFQQEGVGVLLSSSKGKDVVQQWILRSKERLDPVLAVPRDAQLSVMECSRLIVLVRDSVEDLKTHLQKSLSTSRV